jgi:hypothetical protein
MANDGDASGASMLGTCGKPPGSITFLRRFTTLAGAASFSTSPLDVSQLDGVRLQVYRADLLGSGDLTFTVFIEESLDGENWTQGPDAPVGYDPGAGLAQFFSYCFQLRWFRLRVVLTGTDPMVTCWAEGVVERKRAA